MSAVTPANAGLASDPGPLFRLTVAQYHVLAATGILTEDDAVELLEGILVQKMTKNPPHSATVLRLQAVLPPLLPPGWHYRAQEPITLSDGEPEPAGVVARGSINDYGNHHPAGGDIGLVIEVAEATLARDRGIKLRSYARAGIPHYWIVNLIERQIEVYSEPTTDSATEPTYRHREVVPADGKLTLMIQGQAFAGLEASLALPQQD